MSAEIELKLEVAPDATERLIADRPLLDSATCRSERQLSVYYDTPDFRLRKNGYTLRVRSSDGGFTQTLKSLDVGAGLFERSEREWQVKGPEPDLVCLRDTPIADLQVEQVEPVIRSEVDRTICRLEQAGSEIEIDVDLGTMRAATREMPVSELEVELISGQPRAALDLAQRIAEELPVKLAVMSKAERGFALADGKMSEPAKAEPVRIRPGTGVVDGFGIIVSACLRHFRLNEPLVIELREAEALHQARVGMRRLRSALSLFRPVVSDEAFERIEDELSWFTAELGDARNLDVYLQRDLSEDQRHFIEERRERAYDLAIAAMNSPRFRRLMLDLVGWTALGQWRESPAAAMLIEPFANGRIDRLWSKICDSKTVAKMGDKQRHRLRIRMKKLRYALEFVDALHTRKPGRRKKFAKIVKALQESLGDLHDIVTARSLVTVNSWLMTPGLSAKKERHLVRDADRAIHRLRKVGPYWRAPSLCAPQAVTATSKAPVAW
jgi:inorganic triphosphatase YgiF